LKKKPPKKLSRARQRQRAHAKRRFQERFDITLNRHQMRDIEQKITRGEAVLIDSTMAPRMNYFVEVDGRLVAVGYNCRTKRVVTALPNTYVEQLDPELVSWAKVQLIPGVAAHVLGLIQCGDAEVVESRSRHTAVYQVIHDGEVLRLGYHSGTKRLFRPKKRLRKGAV
jgi:hypothetical protein